MRLSLSGRVAANSLVQMAGNGLGVLVALVSFAAIARSLGPASFGDLAAATAFVAIPLLFGDVGLNWNVLRELSKDPGKARLVLGSSIVARCAISAVCLSVAVAIARLLPFNPQVEYAITVGAVGAFFKMVDSSLLPALQAELRMQWITLTSALSRLLTLALLLGVIAAGYGFHAIVWVYVVGNAANLAMDAVVVKRVAGVTLTFNVRDAVMLLRGTVVLGLAMTCGTAYWYVDRVLLSLLRPPEEVGLYGAAFKYVELSFFVVNAISLSVFPLLVRAITAGSRERIGFLLQWSLDLLLIAGVPLCAAALVLADDVITAVTSAEFADAAPALRVFGFAVLVIFIAAPFERTLIAGHHERLLVKLNVSALAANVGVSLIVIPVYGYLGLAVASLAVNAMWVLAAGVTTCRLYGFRPRLHFPALAALAGGAMAAAMALAPTGYIGAVGATLVYVGLVVLVPGSGREVVRRLIAEIRSFRRASSTALQPTES